MEPDKAASLRAPLLIALPLLRFSKGVGWGVIHGAVLQVGGPVLTVFGGEFRIVNHQKIFRIVFFGRRGEVERPGDHYLTVDYQELVVRNRMGGIDIRGDAGME